MRPGTRQSTSIPPGTGLMRPGTRGVLGSRAGGATSIAPGSQGAIGVAISTDLSVLDRPVTQQGMRGGGTSRGSTAGPGRQIADHSYYIGVVRAKLNEIEKEMKKLSNEIEMHHRDNNQYGSYERRYEKLLKEVRMLEGELADHNLALDRIRTSTDPDDMRSYIDNIKSKNNQEAEKADKILLSKRGKEKEFLVLQEEIKNLEIERDNKIRDMDTFMSQNYQNLLSRNKNLKEEEKKKNDLLNEINNRCEELGQNLGSKEPMNDTYNILEKKVLKLKKEQDLLNFYLSLTEMDSKEAHATLLKKFKGDQKTVSELDTNIRLMFDEITRRKKHLMDLNKDITDRQSNDRQSTNNATSEAQKYEVLYKRDQEMSDFIDKFHVTKEQVLKDQRELKRKNVALLEHISRDIESETNMPSKDRLLEMKDEVSFKEKQLACSEETITRLTQEKTKRVEELKNLNTLEEKMANELDTIAENIDAMMKDMQAFKDVDGMKASAEKTEVYLKNLKESYIKRKNSMKQQVQTLSASYEAKKKQLSTNEAAIALESLEQKMSHYEQNIFAMKEDIQVKSNETDYHRLKDDSSNLFFELNKLTKAYVDNGGGEYKVGTNY